MNDLTHGINPYQSVEGMVKDYEKKVAREEATLQDPDITDGRVPRSEMEPNREGELMVSKGRLNPETGAEIPLTPKARKVLSFVPSARYIKNFEAIRWD
jgi:hypothetical protein